MQSNFKDHFSGHASDYARHRPTYPDQLFSEIAKHTPARAVAWDCGCGNGQASVGLAKYFNQVIATDASADQIRNAIPDSSVSYRVGLAEQSNIDDRTVDAVVVAQALHWFSHAEFYKEVKRVSQPGALFIAVMYEMSEITPEIDAEVLRFYRGDINSYWPPDRRHIENHYSSIPWEFPCVDFPRLAMECIWTIDDLGNYLSTWSAVQRFRADTERDPIPEVLSLIRAVWGSQTRRIVRWPLTILAGRVE